MRVVLPCLMLLVVQSFGQEFKWNKVKVDGVDYISIAQLALFYGFNGPEIKGDEVTLMNKDLTMVFEGGTKKASFNKVGFLLGRDLVQREGEALLSVTDLTLMIDPVLRPAQVRGLGGFDTVIFNLDFPEGFLTGNQFETELRRRVETHGFKVVFLEPKAKPGAVLAKFQEGLEGGSAVYLEISFRQGIRRSLKTRSVGGLSKPSLALATGIHWTTLRGLEGNQIEEFEDGRIALGESGDLKKLKSPGCRMELTMDFSGETASGADFKKLHQSVARSLGQALVFTRKAGRQREEEAVKEATGKEK